MQQSEYHLKDLTFPECRVALEPLRPRNKTAALEYRAIFLTGHIRQTIRTARQKNSISDKQIMPLGHTSWPRLATFFHLTHFHYMTLHSIDGRIIQADKRSVHLVRRKIPYSNYFKYLQNHNYNRVRVR